VAHGQIVDAVERIYAEDGWTPNRRVIWDAHGIGLDVIEPPIVLRDGAETLQQNMAINVHPGLAYGDRMLGLYIQDNYVVQEGGATPLSGWDHVWHVLD
jgi:Xaa-Pro aminopeptidase